MRAIPAVCLVVCLASVAHAEEKPATFLNSVLLYLPDDALRQRLGDDVSPLALYIKSLQKETATFLEKVGRPKAKGLLVAVGVKPGRMARVWCDAVDGEIPI